MGWVQLSHMRHSGQDNVLTMMVPMTKDVLGQLSLLQLNKLAKPTSVHEPRQNLPEEFPLHSNAGALGSHVTYAWFGELPPFPILIPSLPVFSCRKPNNDPANLLCAIPLVPCTDQLLQSCFYLFASFFLILKISGLPMDKNGLSTC